jgi:hypothetical protein
VPVCASLLFFLSNKSSGWSFDTLLIAHIAAR